MTNILKILAAIVLLSLGFVLLFAAGLILWFNLVEVHGQMSDVSFEMLSFGPWTFSGWQIYFLATCMALIGAGFIYCSYLLFTRKSEN